MKERWQIAKNWQFIFPILGILAIALASYSIARRFLQLLQLNNSFGEWIFAIGAGAALYYLILKTCLWCFKKLEHRWAVNHRWEMIAIFLVFAITGSASAKFAGPVLDILGLQKDTISGWIYWPLRILLIFPIYQILLVVFGWFFGQFKFFWNFEKKMLKHLGLGFLFK